MLGSGDGVITRHWRRTTPSPSTSYRRSLMVRPTAGRARQETHLPDDYHADNRDTEPPPPVVAIS